MNKKLIILLYLIVTTLFLGCTNAENITSASELDLNNSKDIKYTIEKIYFSKAFQSIAPNVEAIESDGKKTLALNLGLSQYSEISIDDIKLEGNEFNIYISGYNDKSTTSLSVPQVILAFEDLPVDNIKDINFNIIYNDYDYIDIKFEINDVLNKLESQFGLSLSSLPNFNLIEKDDKIIWEIEYENIISTESDDYPLINLIADIDANTGEVITYDKNTISSAIDRGKVLNLNDNGLLLYEKIINNNSETSSCELWLYDSNTEEKNMIYNCKSSLLSAESSDDLANIAFIEKTDIASEAYIYSNIDSKIYKLQFENDFNPQVLKWKDDNTLYLVENNSNNSIIYSYKIDTNESQQISNVNKSINNIIVGDDEFIVVENIDESDNKKLSLTDDFKKYIDVGLGFNPKYIDNDIISYLENDENTDMNHLIIYNIREDKIISLIKENILNYRVNPPDNIVYIKNNPKYKDYTLSRYSLRSDESTDLINIIDKDIYYNDKKNLIYLNVELPFEDEDLNIIHSISLEE